MKWLTSWKIAIGELHDEKEVFRGMRKIEDLVCGVVRRVDMSERIGITGILRDDDGNCIDGVDDVEPMRIRRMERLHRRRRFFDSLYVMAWQLTKVKEVYRVYTDKGIYHIKVRDMSADTLAILNDLLEGVGSLEKLRMGPVTSLLI